MKKVFITIICLSLVVLVFSLIMIFKPTRKITIKMLDGNEVVREMKVEKGDVIHLPELTKEKYAFDGWYYGEKKLNKSAWFNQDSIVTAHWKELPPQMTISYNTNGGREIAPSTINCDEPLTLPIPYREDYEFKNWQDTNKNIITNESKLKCEDITLIANWQRNSNVTYDTNKNSYQSLDLESTLSQVGIKKQFGKHSPSDNAITIYLFHGKECPHCHEFLSFLNSITNEYGKYFKLESYEVWHNQNNAKLFAEASTHLGNKASGVPYIIIGKQTIKGYSKERNEDIKKAIMDLYNQKSINRYDVLKDMGIN